MADLSDALTAVQSALTQAIEMRDSAGYFMPESTISGYTTAINLVQNRILPNLISTLGQAMSDFEYAKKWISTAESARSTLDFVSKDSQEASIWNELSYTVRQTVSDIGEKTSEGIDWWEKYHNFVYVGVAAIGLLYVLVLVAPVVSSTRMAYGSRG